MRENSIWSRNPDKIEILIIRFDHLISKNEMW